MMEWYAVIMFALFVATLLALLVQSKNLKDIQVQLASSREYNTIMAGLLNEKTDRSEYRELPTVDPHLYQQFLLGLVEGEHFGFLVDSYMHQFVDQCGSLAESGNVNAELLNSGKIQAIKGLYHHVMVQANAIKAQQALEQHEGVIHE